MIMVARLLFVALATLSLHAQPDPLIGLWSYQTRFGPAPAELKVIRAGAQWRAQLGEAKASADVDGDRVRFRFADGGEFRGTLAGDAIDGYWIRPGVSTDPRYPGGSSQAFATPLTLRRSHRSTWRATVRPLPDPFTLYLKVFRNEKDELIAAFRNPEQNSIGGAMQFRVAREGDAVHFTAQDLKLEAKLAGDRLRIFWPDLEREIELTKGSPAAFYPRPPSAAPYQYAKPPDTGDGWTTARASTVGLDEEALKRLIRRLADADPAVRRASLIHSLLVARQGKLVLEEYFFGFDRDTPHDLRSASKTFAAVLLGTAMHKGVAVSPDTKLYELVAKRGPFANPDPRKARITLGHLMTHAAGFACDDNKEGSPGAEDTMQTQHAQPDWWKFTLDLPMEYEPGTHYAYCSANTNLMGAAITTATSTWLPEWFDRTVARPLQFSPWHWNLMENDEGYLGGGVWLRPRDLLKVGQTWLDGGVWRGRRIVDAKWVAQSTAPHFHISPTTTGLTPEQFSDSYMEADEGLAWHLGKVQSDQRSYRTYSATGNGGQLLIVIPELDMVVVFTGGNYRQGGIWLGWVDGIIGGAIIPALR